MAIGFEHPATFHRHAPHRQVVALRQLHIVQGLGIDLRPKPFSCLLAVAQRGQFLGEILDHIAKLLDILCLLRKCLQAQGHFGRRVTLDTVMS